MTTAEARGALGNFVVPAGAERSGCDYATSTRLPRGVSVMVVEGLVVRVDVDSNTVATAEGARIGDAEKRVRALYGARVRVSPHEYTDGHYLTVRPATGDTSYLIVFETNGDTVAKLRAGRVPHVQYVEGCS